MKRRQRRSGSAGHLELNVLSHHPEFAEEILLAHGAQSVTQLDAGDDPVLEPGPGETPLWPQTRCVGLFPKGTDLAPAIAALRSILPDGEKAIVTRAALADRDWVRLWLRNWKALRFGKRLWVTPRAKRRQIRGRNAVVVTLDPGLAFGTGTHPSTALCLDWIAAADLTGARVLDFGCGSGVLGIAALKCGAKSVMAVDIDPQALAATHANARANRVDKKVTVRLPKQYRGGRYDVVLANILAGPLVQLAPVIGGSLAPGGSLVLAGLLAAHADEVAEAYRPWCGDMERAGREAWVRLSGTCAADGPSSRSAARQRRKARPK